MINNKSATLTLIDSQPLRRFKSGDKAVLPLRLGILLCYFTCNMALKAAPIPSNYQQIALEHNIPAAVIYGIALAESGHRLNKGVFKPWPWTLNVVGIPRRYPTRKAAYQGLVYYLSKGIKSIDIGFMQVNWRYHHQKLGKPWQALDPFHNIRTAAAILQQEYQNTGDWQTAMGRYHSPGPKSDQKKRAINYASRVMKHIQRITQQKV